MANRVEQIILHVRKLAQATGVKMESRDTELRDLTLDGVTSDLDIEALSNSLLDVSRDLDLYLQTLLDPPDLPVSELKSDITQLEAELAEKDVLLEKTVEMVKKTEITFRKLKQQLLRDLYHL